MKAKLFATALSMSILTAPLYTITAIAQSAPSPQVKPLVNKINLNTASVDALTNSFKGIGEKRAQAIVNYREKQGKFKSIDELAKVKGLSMVFVSQHLNELQQVFSVE